MTGEPPGSDAVGEALEAQLRAIRSAYALALPGKVDALARAIGEARARGARGAPDAVARAHRLAGSAGSYGCAAVGEAARQMERALEGLDSATDPARSWAEIEALLGQARAEAEVRAEAARARGPETDRASPDVASPAHGPQP